jgi:pyruvate kinase
LRAAEAELVRLGLVKDGDMMVMTIGEAIGTAGHTNTMKIVRVGDHRKA